MNRSLFADQLGADSLKKSVAKRSEAPLAIWVAAFRLMELLLRASCHDELGLLDTWGLNSDGFRFALEHANELR